MTSEQSDPDSNYDPTAASGTENTPEHETGPADTELVPPGSTADGAGTSLGGEPDEEEEPLGTGDGTAASEQLADERWRTNGVDPLG
ncbi:hypothetical protein HQQ80_12140 [Microbacteriaceae bacterium VKM Ac-2855]|nr:hypothetical protein [Microbacteriaceae bacterium VKM Ac-2855]